MSRRWLQSFCGALLGPILALLPFISDSCAQDTGTGSISQATIADASSQDIAAGPNPFDGNWHFSLTPYIWLPSVNATLRFGNVASSGSSVDATVGPSSYVGNLNFAMELGGEARKGPWSAITDILYVNVSGQGSTVKSITGPGGIVTTPIDTGSQTGVSGAIWTLAGGYSVAHTPTSNLDVLAGFRFAGLSTSLDWQFAGPAGLLPASGSVSDSVDLWEGIIGARGRVQLGNSAWYVPYYFDVGTGTAPLTAQGILGIGYTYKWLDTSLAYRYLYYDMGSDNLIQHLSFSGPELGFTFHF
jgi:hypothetical protein